MNRLEILNRKEEWLVRKLKEVRADRAKLLPPSYRAKSWLQWTPRDVSDAINDGFYTGLHILRKNGSWWSETIVSFYAP